MKATVIVMPKENVLDPQGVAVREAMRHQGMAGVKNVRVGKLMEIELENGGSPNALEAICRDLLSNPVIEDYQLKLEG
jgi:phosphoribosylformylglycinamidine synthase PurS subunit